MFCDKLNYLQLKWFHFYGSGLTNVKIWSFSFKLFELFWCILDNFKVLSHHDIISYCFQNLTKKKKSIEYIYGGKILLLHVAGDIFLIILHIF